MKFIVILSATILLVSQIGCLAPTSLQSGRTIGKDKPRLLLSVSSGQYHENIASFNPNEDVNYIPIVEVRQIYGITKTADVGVRFNSLSLLAGDIKFQFLGNQNSVFASSIGAECGIYPFALVNGGLIAYTSIPLYLSVHPTDNLSLFAVPRYTYGFRYIYDESSLKPGYSAYANFPGISYGLLFGKEHQFGIEISHFNKNLLKPSQLSIGYIFPYSINL